VTETSLLTDGLPTDVSGWWVSEKYDGIRAIWTGSALTTRNGKRLAAPTSWLAGLPKGVRLDGELWMGRQSYEGIRAAIQTRNSDWAGVRYMVFDLAEAGEFEDRFSRLSRLSLPSHAVVAPQWACEGHDDLSETEAAVVKGGGEGLVIRRPGSLYRPGRAGDTIKVKRLVADIDRWQG
jgi:DNA ligase-1